MKEDQLLCEVPVRDSSESDTDDDDEEDDVATAENPPSTGYFSKMLMITLHIMMYGSFFCSASSNCVIYD